MEDGAAGRTRRALNASRISRRPQRVLGLSLVHLRSAGNVPRGLGTLLELVIRPNQDFALNLSTKRRLCHTVGGRIVEGCAACCCAVPAARARAATTTNLARSSLALVLRARFGGAKSCALVKFFMICPRLS